MALGKKDYELAAQIIEGLDTAGTELGFVVNVPDGRECIVTEPGVYSEDEDTDAGDEPVAKRACTRHELAKTIFDEVINMFRDSVFKRFRPFCSSVTDGFDIRVGGVEMPLMTPDLDVLREIMRPAAFGDMKSNTTVVDPGVRNALSTHDIEVVDFDKLTHAVLTEFAGGHGVFAGARNISLKVHALNLYLEGGHFMEHLDTQRDPRMVGTVTIIAGDYDGGELAVSKEQGCVPKLFSTKNVLCKTDVLLVAMLATCPHEVKPVTRGWRISLTLDVLSELDMYTPEALKAGARVVDSIDRFLAAFPDVPAVGVQTKHPYTLDDIAAKRARTPGDAGLFAASEGRGHVLSLLWKVEATFPTDAPPVLSKNHVYTTDAADERYRGSLFVHSGEPSWTLRRDAQKPAEYTGNEAMDGKDNSVYLCTYVMFERVPS